jgi:hypothetical protein
MSQPPLNNPGARYWDELVEEFDFSPDEHREIREGANHMIAEVRARRLAEVRKRHSRPRLSPGLGSYPLNSIGAAAVTYR